MLKFLDKYEKYLVYVMYFIFECFLIFELVTQKETIFLKLIELIAFSLMGYFLVKWLFGGLSILFLIFIAHLIEYKNLNFYLKDVSHRDTTEETIIGITLFFGLIMCAICTVFLTYIFEFLFQDYGIHFVDKLVEDYFLILFFGYLISIGIIFWLAYLVRLNPFAVLVSLVGLVILLPNLFRYNVNQIESIEKLLATVKIFFGLLFLILPWLFDRSYKRIE
jgi:hypothetical protein